MFKKHYKRVLAFNLNIDALADDNLLMQRELASVNIQGLNKNNAFAYELLLKRVAQGDQKEIDFALEHFPPRPGESPHARIMWAMYDILCDPTEARVALVVDILDELSLIDNNPGGGWPIWAVDRIQYEQVVQTRYGFKKGVYVRVHDDDGEGRGRFKNRR